jgi:hypothetical protein
VIKSTMTRNRSMMKRMRSRLSNHRKKTGCCRRGTRSSISLRDKKLQMAVRKRLPLLPGKRPLRIR